MKNCKYIIPTVFTGNRLFLLLRYLIAIFPSYIHPDEHLQGPEYIFSIAFGWSGNITWEFVSDNPARSTAVLWIVYSPIIFILKLFNLLFKINIKPFYAFLFLRLYFFTLFLISYDYAFNRLIGDNNNNNNRNNYKKNIILYYISLSYVSCTYQAHSFSNSIETIIVLCSLVEIKNLIIYTRKLSIKENNDNNNNNNNNLNALKSSIKLGILISLGIFNRITFPAFLVFPGLKLISKFKQLFLIFFFLLFSSLILISIDSLIFMKFVIAPWNNILYNLQTSNLAHHGLHPFYTHFIVNLPQLLGPGILLISPLQFFNNNLTFLSALSGILLLSLFLHQEARFLLPSIPLLCANFSLIPIRNKRKKIFYFSWLIFNIIMAFIIGIMHQGGIVPMQLYISDNIIKKSIQPSIVIYWRTYPPPLWLLGNVSVTNMQLFQTEEMYSLKEYNINDTIYYCTLSCNESLQTLHNDYNDNKNPFILIDIMGAPQDSLYKVLNDFSNYKLHLVAPTLSIDQLKNDSLLINNYILQHEWYYPFHYSIEYMKTIRPGLSIVNIIPKPQQKIYSNM